MGGTLGHRIDELGRVVVPASVRREKGWEPGTPIGFEVLNDEVVIYRLYVECPTCRKRMRPEDMVTAGTIRVCKECAAKLGGTAVAPAVGEVSHADA